MRNFLFGFVAGVAILLVVAWFARQDLLKWISVAYETVDSPAVLLTDIELRQNGKEVGRVNKGTVILLKGRAKDSPMEYFSVSVGWENRGVDDKGVYRAVPKDQSTMVEMVIPKP